VGQQPAAKVDPAQGEQPPAEKAVEPDVFAAIDRKGDQRQRQGGGLDPRIKPAERVAAEPASPLRDEPAEKRHEIARPQWRSAPFAAGPRPRNRSAIGQASDNDAEKAPDEWRSQEHSPSGVEQLSTKHALSP